MIETIILRESIVAWFILIVAVGFLLRYLIKSKYESDKNE